MQIVAIMPKNTVLNIAQRDSDVNTIEEKDGNSSPRKFY